MLYFTTLKYKILILAFRGEILKNRCLIIKKKKAEISGNLIRLAHSFSLCRSWSFCWEKNSYFKKRKKEGGYFESENVVCFSETEINLLKQRVWYSSQAIQFGIKKRKQKQQLWGSKCSGKSKWTRQSKLPDIKLCTTTPNKDREQGLPAPLTGAPEPAEMSRTGDAPLRSGFCSLKNYTVHAQLFHFPHASNFLFLYDLFFELEFMYSLAGILALKTISIA